MAEIFARVFWRRIWSLAAKVAVSDSSSSLKNLIHHTRGVDRDGTAFGLQQGWDVDLSCRIKKPASHRATPILRWRRLCWVAWLTLWGVDCWCVSDRETEPSIFPLLFRTVAWVDFLLRWTHPQCRCNIPKELVELASAFAGAKNIWVIIDDQTLVLIHLFQYCCSLNHADFAL